MGEIHELFVLALSLVWFAGATPEVMSILLIFLEVVLGWGSMGLVAPYRAILRYYRCNTPYGIARYVFQGG